MALVGIEGNKDVAVVSTRKTRSPLLLRMVEENWRSLEKRARGLFCRREGKWPVDLVRCSSVFWPTSNHTPPFLQQVAATQGPRHAGFPATLRLSNALASPTSTPPLVLARRRGSAIRTKEGAIVANVT